MVLMTLRKRECHMFRRCNLGIQIKKVFFFFASHLL
jgi:hypothetical protein